MDNITALAEQAPGNDVVTSHAYALHVLASFSHALAKVQELLQSQPAENAAAAAFLVANQRLFDSAEKVRQRLFD